MLGRLLSLARAVQPQQGARHRVLRQTAPDSGPFCRVSLGALMDFSVLHCFVSAVGITIPISFFKKYVLIYLTALDLSGCGIRDHVP